MKLAVLQAKQRVCEDLYARLDSREEEKDSYGLVGRSCGDVGTWYSEAG